MFFQNSASITHELLHSLGVMHEQKRPDRDNYVTIHFENLKDNAANQYWRDVWEGSSSGDPVCSLSGNDGTDYTNCVSGKTTVAFDLPYDPDSIMHYFRLSSLVQKSIATTVYMSAKFIFYLFIRNGLDQTANVISWKSNPSRNFGASQLSQLDIKKLNASYGCSSNTAGQCYLHYQQFDGVLSSQDTLLHGCQILFHSLYGSVEIVTTKFQVTNLTIPVW